VVDTGLRDTIEWAVPQILRVFLAGQQVVEFEPQSEQDEAAAKQDLNTLTSSCCNAMTRLTYLDLVPRCADVEGGLRQGLLADAARCAEREL